MAVLKVDTRAAISSHWFVQVDEPLSIRVGQAPTSVNARPTRRNAMGLLCNWLVDDTTASSATLSSISVQKNGRRGKNRQEQRSFRTINEQLDSSKADNHMSLSVAHYPEEDRLDLTIEGNLDLTLTNQIMEACEYVDTGLAVCVIDASRVTRVFDSGLAVLMLLANRLAQFRARLVIIGNDTGLEFETLPAPLRHAVCA